MRRAAAARRVEVREGGRLLRGARERDRSDGEDDEDEKDEGEDDPLHGVLPFLETLTISTLRLPVRRVVREGDTPFVTDATQWPRGVATAGRGAG
jgi:hypothetical protein